VLAIVTIIVAFTSRHAIKPSSLLPCNWLTGRGHWHRRLLGCQNARRGQTAPNHITEKVTSCCTTLNLLAKLITNMWPSSRKPYYALNPVRLFVRPSVCPLPADNLKTENHTTFKFRGQVTPTSGITYRRKKQLAVEQV